MPKGQSIASLGKYQDTPPPPHLIHPNTMDLGHIPCPRHQILHYDQSENFSLYAALQPWCNFWLHWNAWLECLPEAVNKYTNAWDHGIVPWEGGNHRKMFRGNIYEMRVLLRFLRYPNVWRASHQHPASVPYPFLQPELILSLQHFPKGLPVPVVVHWKY